METHSTIQYFVEQSAKMGNYLFVKLKMIAVSNADTTNFNAGLLIIAAYLFVRYSLFRK